MSFPSTRPASSPSVRPAAEPATHTRYWVVLFALTLAVLSYIDRVCISQAAPVISRDLGFNKAQMGYIMSAFGVGYALFEIPGGYWGDRLGVRRVLMRIVLWWSLFTAATGWMWSFTSMAVTRFLFGAGEAGCFPNLTKAFSIWLPQREKTTAQGIMWTLARWGGAFTPLLVVQVFKFASWRTAFGLFGLLGVVWAIFFYRWYRDNPRDHKSVNAAELALLEESSHLAESHGNVPWGELLRSRTIWLLWLQYFCLSYPWYFYITWLPTFLQEYPYGRLTPEVAAQYAILPLFFGGIGSLISGFLLPRLAARSGDLRRTRRTMATCGFLGASILLFASIQTHNVLYAVLFMGLTSFCNDLVMPAAWSTCMDVGGKYAGTVSGSMNMMGNVAGFTAPSIGGAILQRTGGDWNIFLYTMVAAYVLGMLCWPFIDPVTPIRQSED